MVCPEISNNRRVDRLSAMQAFVAVVETGAFARAAERLGASTSSLSRLVGDLETHLGARLLNRTTRRLSLTEGGQAFYERCVQLLAELAEAEAVASLAAAAPRGRIKLTCSVAIGLQRVAPAIARFSARYPDVKFDVTVADRLIDLVEEGFDLAIRIGRVGGESLVARKLGEMSLVMCASPAYLAQRGTPSSPADLAAHNLFTYAYGPHPNLWRLTDAQGQEHQVRANGTLHANSGDLLVEAAVAGLGVALEPDFIVGAHLAAGRLIRVLPGYSGQQGDIWAVYPSRRHLSVKVRLFVEHLSESFAPAPPMPAGNPRAARQARRR
jgi:DNA-binding transcriptional LysR family regulator